MKVILLFLTIFVLCSCNSRETNKSNTPPPVEQPAVVRQLFSDIKPHAFSDPAKLDTFKLSVKGTSLLNSDVLFEVHNYEGKQIYSRNFPVNYLLGYDTNRDDTTKQSIIENRLKTFFDESNFLVPAIKTTDIYDRDYSDKKIWDEVRSNKQAIGFSYLIGEEETKKIAFSKREGKALMYYSYK